MLLEHALYPPAVQRASHLKRRRSPARTLTAAERATVTTQEIGPTSRLVQSIEDRMPAGVKAALAGSTSAL